MNEKQMCKINICYHIKYFTIRVYYMYYDKIQKQYFILHKRYSIYQKHLSLFNIKQSIFTFFNRVK